MKATIKLLLLVVAVLLAVGGIMVYQKTQVTPPTALKFDNQYVNAARKEIAGIDSLSTGSALDYAYDNMISRLKIQHENSFLSDEERDSLLSMFAVHYEHVYNRYCESVFEKSVWNADVLHGIGQRISDMRSLQTTDGKKVVPNALKYEDNVIRSYNAARQAATVGGYAGIQAAGQKIASAKKYAVMSPVNNCTELVSSLNSVAARLEQAHYSYLAGQVERLRHYQNYTENQYEALAQDVVGKLEEYQNNASKIYGTKRNISELKERAGTYYSQAEF